ncbi:MAG TPA: hypothetical protein VEQ58_01615 [Polyangiaceae bacterium]|nr:hypothetical protein [Polyangiaceae bacterium]
MSDSLLARSTKPALWLLSLAASIASCGLDERPLSFKIGAHASTSGSSGGDPTGVSDGGAASANPASGGAFDDAAVLAGQNAGGAATQAGGGAGSDGGTGSVAGDDNGGSLNAGPGGADGGGGEPSGFACGDLNHNGVDDCTETLVANSRFDADAAHWDAEASLLQKWTKPNVTDSSGALSVTNIITAAGLGGNIAVGSRQCVVAWTGQSFDVGAKIFIKGGQGSGEAGVNLLFFANDDCDGTFIEGKTVGNVSDVDAWRTVEDVVAVPAASRSMFVRLMVVKPLAQTSFEVLFDDVLVSEKK